MNKDLIIAISGEMGSGGGCWYHRIATIANHLNASPKYGVKVIETPEPIFDANLLMRTRCILVQRPVATMPWLKNYKELQAKYSFAISGEIDDAWWNIIPEYNMSSLNPRDWDAIDRTFRENLQYIDRMIVTTEFMRRKLNKDYNYWNVRVVENAAPKSLYSTNKKTFFRERPLCIIPSGMQHYRTPQPMCPQFPLGVTGL